MLSPIFDFDLAGYRDIILLDKPLCEGYLNYIKSNSDAKIWLIDGALCYSDVELNREIIGDIYREITKIPQGVNIFNFYNTLLVPGFGINQWALGIAVLNEIGVINIERPYTITFNRGIKADLGKSKILARVGK